MVRRFSAVTVGVIIGAACVTLAIFLHNEGLIRAGAWAGIIGLLGVPIGLLGVWLAWPRDRDDATAGEHGPSAQIQQNTTSQHGTTFAVQDGHQTINYYRPPNDAGNDLHKEDGGHQK